MRSFKRILSVVLLVLWMGFIFYMSAQPAEVSSQMSGEVIEIVAEKFYPNFEALSELQKAELVESYQFIVRKALHIVGFAILGFFAFLSFISYTKLRFFTRIFLATAVSIIYAASDEFHQHFVSGRNCELRDLLLDAAGILGAIILCTLFVKIIGPWRRKTAFCGATKKKLKALNNELYEKLDDEKQNNKQLESRVVEQEKVIENLSAEILKKAALEVQIEPEREEKELEARKEIKLSSETEYAAKIIGEAVVEVTKVCNKITATGGENAKELVNLALGRNEVLKAEILKILGCEASFEDKQNLILTEMREAYDYFNSILAQMC